MTKTQITDDHVYDTPGLAKVLDFSPQTIRRAAKAGELKYSEAAGRCWYLGKDVKAWLGLGDKDMSVLTSALTSNRHSRVNRG